MAYVGQGITFGVANTNLLGNIISSQITSVANTQITGSIILSQIGGLGSNVVTFLTTPSSSNLANVITDDTGTGSIVFATSPTLVTPALGVPASGNLISCTADGTNSVGFKNIPVSSSKTSIYNPVASDIGKTILLGSGGNVILTASVFSAGDAFSIFNNTTGTITCNVAAITTVYKSGIDGDVSTFDITTRGIATILFISTTTAVVAGSIT